MFCNSARHNPSTATCLVAYIPGIQIRKTPHIRLLFFVYKLYPCALRYVAFSQTKETQTHKSKYISIDLGKCALLKLIPARYKTQLLHLKIKTSHVEQPNLNPN